MKISLVTPVYNEVLNVQKFYSAIKEILSHTEMDWEIIYCVDPSSDGTEREIEKLHSSDNRVKMLSFSRRVGQDAALIAGIKYASGDAAVILDCDLQDPPELIPKMIQEWRNGFPMVLGVRKTRAGEPTSKALSSKIFYKFLNKFGDIPFPENSGDFRLIDRKVIEEINKFEEQKPFLRGIISYIAPKSTTVEFDRVARELGETKYNPVLGGYKIAINAVIGYSNVLLRFSLISGLIISAFSIFFGLIYVTACLINNDLPKGIPTIVIMLSLLGGAILFSNGVLGIYLGRIFNETKKRPNYYIAEKIGF